MSGGELIIEGTTLVSSNNVYGHVCIPSSITSISSHCFENDRLNVTQVSFEADSILSDMQQESFANLNSVVFIDFRHCLQLTSIPNMMCFNCPNLVKVYLPDDGILNSIGSAAFSDCFNLEYINIPPSVEIFQSYSSTYGGLFRNCFKLSRIHMSPSSRLKTLATHCFIRSYFEFFCVPRSVNQILNSPFYGSERMQFFEFEEGNPNFHVEEEIVYSSDKSTIVLAYPTIRGNITIPSHSTSIINQAFRGCKYLTGITIPHSFNSISSYAFQDCPNLNYVFIPSSVTSLSDASFSRCSIKTFIIEGSPTITGTTFQGSNINCGFQITDDFYNYLISINVYVGRNPCIYPTISSLPQLLHYSTFCFYPGAILGFHFIHIFVFVLFFSSS